jgi:tRNA G18 (ribose-2'-O)-methylase SpoU
MKNQARSPLTVVLENIRSALNVGAIFRTSDAVNIERLILAGITPYPPHNRIPKTALGAVETVPWEYIKDYTEPVIQLAKQKPLIAIELAPDAKNLYEYRFPKEVTLVFGNEISGVSPWIMDLATAVIQIPMFGKKESLNIATSYGIVVYEVIRQWKYSHA